LDANGEVGEGFLEIHSLGVEGEGAKPGGDLSGNAFRAKQVLL
jgi:hypothetical protein